jgi:hypothetical protein
LLSRARELALAGLAAEEIAAKLEEELPGRRLTDGPEWRRDVEYANPAAIATMERERGRLPGVRLGTQNGDAPAAAHAFVPMSSQLLAFAEVRDWRCAHCGRVGSRAGDPDGASWRKDLVPGTAKQVLSCSGCVGGASADDGL